MNARWFLGMLLSGLFLCSPAHAGPILVDEFGTGIGTLGPGFIARDPGPGGLPAVLTYPLPFAGVQGDVFLTDADFGGISLDVIRFNGNGTLLFYSDNVGGFDALGDNPSPPIIDYSNAVSLPEIGPEGNNGAFYTPLPGQPGFDISRPIYHFVSDGRVPEPPTSLLLGAGLITLLCYARRQERKSV
jgi:hypothetical protein